MGGRAFLGKLPGAKFPRMDPQTYQLLKLRHLEQLRQRFRLVGVPHEAPEKTSHGDIDYIVSFPLDKSSSPEELKHLLGAVHYIPDGHTLNLAIPLQGRDASTFYQVDINRCQNEEMWERTMFFHSYGDLGMIMGLIARVNGLSLGLNGLKVPSSPQYDTPFVLSASFPRILHFFGLDIAAWKSGFPSLQTAFQWIGSSCLFDPFIIKELPHREHRMKDREMYQRFLSWVKDQRENVQQNEENRVLSMRHKKIFDDAMLFFGKRQEYERLVEEKQKRREVKDKFNGHLVMEWTGMRGKSVQVLMKEVRKNLDLEMMHSLTLEEINTLVLQVQEKMSM